MFFEPHVATRVPSSATTMLEKRSPSKRTWVSSVGLPRKGVRGPSSVGLTAERMVAVARKRRSFIVESREWGGESGEGKRRKLEKGKGREKGKRGRGVIGGRWGRGCRFGRV